MRSQQRGITHSRFSKRRQRYKRPIRPRPIFHWTAEPAGAEKVLDGILRLLAPSAPENERVLLYRAATRAQEGRKDQIEQIKAELRRRHEPEDVILRKTAEAAVWAAGYATAKQELVQALKYLQETKNSDTTREALVYQGLASGPLDQANDKEAEPYLRKAYELLKARNSKSSNELRLFYQVSNDLSSALHRMHRDGEARAVRPQARAVLSNDWGFMLTDEEKKSIKEVEHKSK